MVARVADGDGGSPGQRHHGHGLADELLRPMTTAAFGAGRSRSIRASYSKTVRRAGPAEAWLADHQCAGDGKT